MNRVILGPEYFPSPDIGRPISGAQIFVGDVDTDPEVEINQKQVSVLQEDTTIVQVSQPVLTGAGGVPIHNGSPVTILVEGDYALKVLDSGGSQIYYVPSQSSDTDASLINYNQGDTGAVDRTVEERLQDSVSAEDFGTVGDGITDDTAALQAAIDSFGTGGGIVRIIKRYLIDSSLIVKEGVTLKGQLTLPGIPGTGNSEGSNIWNYDSRLVVNSATTITVNGSGSVTNCFVVRKGMITSENSAAAYAGTALTTAGDGVSIMHCLIIGFNQLILASGFQTFTANRIFGDGVNGIHLEGSTDISRIDNCHLWPFGTIDAAAPVETFDTNHFLFRNGTAYNLIERNDVTKLADNFSFGYLKGFKVSPGAGGSIVMSGCSADNINQVDAPYVISGSVGFEMDGDLLHLTDCQGLGQDIGFNLLGAASTNLRQIGMINCRTSGCLSAGLSIVGMHPNVVGGSFSGRGIAIGGTGIIVGAAGIKSIIRDATIYGFTNAIDGGSFPGIVFKNINVLEGSMVNTDLPTVASADPILLSSVTHANDVTVTGTTDFGSASDTYAGHVVRLHFADILTVFDGGNLKMAGNFVTAADSVLTLSFDGTNWNEVSRSSN